MANICGNYISISGDQGQLEALYKRLMNQDPALIRTVPNFEINECSDYCIYDPETEYKNRLSGGSRKEA